MSRRKIVGHAVDPEEIPNRGHGDGENGYTLDTLTGLRSSDDEAWKLEVPADISPKHLRMAFAQAISRYGLCDEFYVAQRGDDVYLVQR